MRRVTIRVDGHELEVDAGTTVAAALWNHGSWACRQSRSGAPRGPLCAMGVCFECRVTVDGRAGRRGCLIPCREGMEVETGA